MAKRKKQSDRRSTEDDPSKYTQLPVELLETQDHENEGIEQMRPLQSSMDITGKVHNGRRPSYPNTGAHTTPMRDPLRITHTRTPSMLTDHSLRITTSHITLENATMGQEQTRPLTEAEERKQKTGTPIDDILRDRLWNKRPDRFAIKIPTKRKAGELVILESKECPASRTNTSNGQET